MSTPASPQPPTRPRLLFLDPNPESIRSEILTLRHRLKTETDIATTVEAAVEFATNNDYGCAVVELRDVNLDNEAPYREHFFGRERDSPHASFIRYVLRDIPVVIFTTYIPGAVEKTFGLRAADDYAALFGKPQLNLDPFCSTVEQIYNEHIQSRKL